MQTQRLTFDPAKHLYTVGGLLYPSVTQVLADTGFVDKSWFTEYARDRGSKVHRAALLSDQGDLDTDNLDPVLRGYVDAWERFRAEVVPEFTAMEEGLFSDTYRFAGTPDRFGLMGTFETVFEIKTGSPEKWHGIQLAGYSILLNKPYCQRVGIYLKEDGRYNLEFYRDRQDGPIFLSALAIHNWRQNAK